MFAPAAIPRFSLPTPSVTIILLTDGNAFTIALVDVFSTVKSKAPSFNKPVVSVSTAAAPICLFEFRLTELELLMVTVNGVLLIGHSTSEVVNDVVPSYTKLDEVALYEQTPVPDKVPFVR